MKLKFGPVNALGDTTLNIVISEKMFWSNNSAAPGDTDKSNWIDGAAFTGSGVKILFMSVEARYHWGLLKARDVDLYHRYFQLGAVVSI